MKVNSWPEIGNPVDIGKMPELKRLLKKAQASREPLILHLDGEAVAVISPLKKGESVIEQGPVTAGSRLWRLIGIGSTEGPGDTSTNKKQHLAEAYLPKRE